MPLKFIYSYYNQFCGKWQYPFSNGECPNAQLNKIKNRKRNRTVRMGRTIATLLKPKTVISLHENSQDGLKIFQLPRKASASTRQCRDIMAQISIDALHSEGVVFVVNIKNVFAWENYIQISRVPICAITFCLRSCIYHLLNRPRGFVSAHDMPYDLPRFPTHHCHDVDIFSCFCAGFILQKPV